MRGYKNVLASLLVGMSFGSAPQIAQAQVDRPPQFILISFDGSYNADMWKATREQALSSGAEVTHFISGVDFLKGSSSRTIPDRTDQIYIPPRHQPGKRRSDIGYGGNHQEVTRRVTEMKRSMDAGMEIGGHANAHFDGSSWSQSEWVYEFDQFNEFVYNVFKINSLSESETGVRVSDWKNSLRGHLKSFRAPYLGRGAGLWKAMGTRGWVIDGQQTNHRMVYDASDVTNSPTAWPEKSQYGFWYMRLATIPVPGKSRPVLSMDYNFYVSDSDNPAAPKDKPSKVGQFEEQMFGAYVNWFNRNYYGNRAPLNIGHHFSTWNQGAYWKALKRFMNAVCTKPEVRCVTGLEAVEFLESKSASQLAAYREGNFNKSGIPQINIPVSTRISLGSTADSYPWVKNGVADLPIKEGVTYSWRLEGRDSNIRKLNLSEVAQKGVSRVDIVAKNQKNEESTMELLIEWNPLTNDTKLVKWLEPLSVPCDETAHEEKVDQIDLHDGVRI